MDNLLIRCSSLYRIMGKCQEGGGLTDAQSQELDGLTEKEKAPRLSEKQYEKIAALTLKKQEGTITDRQKIELDKLLIKDKSPKLTEKQSLRKVELIKKRDYKPEFDLSEGAKTYIRQLVKMQIYNYKIEIENKQLNKGIECEQDSIDLYNQVFWTKHKKNPVRLLGEYLQGECDVVAGDRIQDYKTSWTKDTFPALPDEIDVGGYEWQGRGYMKLWNKPKFELVYCLVETPDHLLDWENNLTLHHIDDIEPELRITTLMFERDLEKEKLIEHKVKECRKYAKWYSNEIAKKFG